MSSCTVLAAPLSHPPLRKATLQADRPLAEGPGYFVDARTGDDAADGAKDRPWRTIQHAMDRLRPGDTLYLRAGTYFENVYCSIQGTAEKPVTIRSYPGEAAVLDGGFREFQEAPAQAWVPGPAEGEFVSAREYPNIRDVVGIFGDSHIGLQTYWHHGDLVAKNELRTTGTGPDKFFYCGPGIYYNKATGKIHVRLAPTHNTVAHMDNYRGEADPRKLPLVIAKFRSVPLHIDQAAHVRFEDLIIRGGGYNNVLMTFGISVVFDHVTIFGGTYCLRSKGTGPFLMKNCGVFGQLPPWSYMTDNALNDAAPQFVDPFSASPAGPKNRNIARLPTHALVVTEAGEESDTFYYPMNNRWEIAYSEFADGHDGVYLNGHDMWMHHCWIDNNQDDATYITSPAPYFCDNVHLSQNYISNAISAFGAHTRGGPAQRIFIYGNVVDLSAPVRYSRPGVPGTHNEQGLFVAAGFFTCHGREMLGIENIGFYHNTAIVPGRHYSFAGSTWNWLTPTTLRTTVNNIFIYHLEDPLPSSRLPKGPVLIDGNLHWSHVTKDAMGPEWLEPFRNSPASLGNAELFKGPPWEVHGKYGDPRFAPLRGGPPGQTAFVPEPDSPAA
ncbi:MAG TPA: hypothetical protein PLS03_16910, partial [Terrimicrobiaceae bacterium]|nr:hypothetical protein [Terrimicrobiaceae bacterium]